ncbi:TetR/AcrR family transcriptional regulator [Vallicoccus soli]|uniref:TetR/AcrR family transcriptional regulator n=1 Tax=Vallicoccus soli TaxID=2339232 RepID=A0A3A3YS70_9ACTN|nr:TetR-like C-terminal domain-containing protein [Vallicoccus soli]RJK94191.1 TetR/AcrR family transcriptional regulator [Vallicoccus soli]
MPRAGLTPERVVAAAAARADAAGWAATTLATVAEQLGVRVPSLYKHVDGLPDLRRRVALAGLRGLAAALREAAVGRSGPDALRAVARAYRAWARDHPGTYEALQRAPAADDEELTAAAADLVGVLTAVLRGWGLEGDDAVHAVRAVRAALHGFCALEAAGGYGLPLDRDESFERLVDLLAGGLRPPGGPGGRVAR